MIVPAAINTTIAIIKLYIASGEIVCAKAENGFVFNILPLN